jgi:kinesin family protein 1
MKVRTNRRYGPSIGRSESRASYLDSIDEDEDDANTTSGSASRPFSGHTWVTDDTSLDSALHVGSISSAEMEEKLRETKEELQKELDAQREEYEAKLTTLAESASTVAESRTEKARAEAELQFVQQQLQSQLDEQKKEYELKMHQLADRAARRKARGFEPEKYEEHELALVQRVIRKWRGMRRVKMAEIVLTNAVLLKEANVFSREFGKKVTYQFTIVDETGIPVSALEGISSMAELDDVSDQALTSQPKPFVAVKVLDSKNNCIYIWSLERLQARVQQMQRLFSLLDKPSYSRHFSLEDPFYQPSPPRYSLFGTASFPLAPLSRKLMLLSEIRIFSPYTGQQVASCTVRLKPLGVTSSTTDYTPSLSNDLLDGSQYSYELNIDSVKGLEATDFRNIHCQVRLASIIGTSDGPDDVLSSPTATLDNSDHSTRLRLRKTLTISITAEILNHMRSNNATIEFYGECNPAYLFKCERWDETKEEKSPTRPWQLSRADSDLPSDTTGRRRETELLTDQIYDVKSMITVQELTSNGTYKPIHLASSTPLDPGVFSCHQGLQRRLSIVLSHGCGRQWIWKGISSVKVGNIRLLDPKGHILDSDSSNTIELQFSKRKPSVEYSADGSAVLAFTAGWDTSTHSSVFLDRITATGHRVLLGVSWELEIEGCPDPIPFSVDIGLTMQERDARGPSKFMSYFTTQKAATQAVSTFQVRLSPAVTNKPSDLWRLNTGLVITTHVA